MTPGEYRLRTQQIPYEGIEADIRELLEEHEAYRRMLDARAS